MKRFFLIITTLLSTVVFSTIPKPFSLHQSVLLDLSTDSIYLQNTNSHSIANEAERAFTIHDASLASNIETATKLKGKTIVLFEPTFFADSLQHYFHLLEHLVGIWNFYGDANHQQVKRIILAGDGKTELPAWEGPNDMNKHLFSALFPNAEVLTYQNLKAKYLNKTVMLEEAFFSDRVLSFENPDAKHLHKMLGGVYKQLDPNKYESMTNAMYRYANVLERPSKKLRVTYISRNKQRYLLPRAKRDLFKRLRELHDVDFQEHYFEKKSFVQQMELIKNTDVLIGVHGNGLSNLLFLPKTSAVIEIMPQGCLMIDYRLFAKIKGIRYYGLQDGKYLLSDERAFERGFYGNPNKAMKTVDVRIIQSILRQERELKRMR